MQSNIFLNDEILPPTAIINAQTMIIGFKHV
ncbi:hypothetical protein F7D08_0186 [Bifidobacterium cebidarum]|uniref:Uncharacterized protein n=1 Tax=Bifidobacterium cebidarum TaxID=2650773 RepID=A0A6I1GC87_9BIFI|nr:hypothetical protein F7D08_0186 [Bifidobacterium cebidarum]